MRYTDKWLIKLAISGEFTDMLDDLVNLSVNIGGLSSFENGCDLLKQQFLGFLRIFVKKMLNYP